MLEAERILASGDVLGPVEGPVPGEIITVLTETDAIAADSPVPGQLAALCQRLGAAGMASPSASRGDPGAVGQRHRAPSAGACRDAQVFAPLACVLRTWTGDGRLVEYAAESHLH